MRRIVLTYIFLSIIGILGAVAQTTPFNRMDPTTGRDQFGNQQNSHHWRTQLMRMEDTISLAASISGH